MTGLHTVHTTPSNGQLLVSQQSTGHSPAVWAEATARALVQVDPAMESDKLLVAAQTRESVRAALLAAFHAVRPTASRAELETLAAQAVAQIADFFRGTPWQMSAEHPQIRDAFHELILRNLTTAADHAAAAE